MMPATCGAHTPSGWPVREPRHDWQSKSVPPPHAVSQHLPSTQNPVEHCELVLHAWPFSVSLVIWRVTTRTVLRSARTRSYAMRSALTGLKLPNDAESSSSGSVEIAKSAVAMPPEATDAPKMSRPEVALLRLSVHATSQPPFVP